MNRAYERYTAKHLEPMLAAARLILRASKRYAEGVINETIGVVSPTRGFEVTDLISDILGGIWACQCSAESLERPSDCCPGRIAKRKRRLQHASCPTRIAIAL